MKQKGFTLTEMIAVVLIIALLTIIILPSILNQLQSQKDNISEASMQLIYDATELYIKERQSMYPMVAGETYCISLESLVNVGKLKNPLQDLSTGKNIPLNKVVKVLVNEYEEGEYSLVDPQAVTCESTVELPEVSVNVEGKKASITLKSEVGVIGYAVTKKEEEVKEWTPVDGLKETTAEWEAKEATEAGDYTAWVKDKYKNINFAEFSIAKAAFSYPATKSTYQATGKSSSYCSQPGGKCTDAGSYCVTWGQKCKNGSGPNFNEGYNGFCPCGKWETGSTTYSCPNGGTLSGTTCTVYSCPNGGTLNNTTCEFK